MPSKSAPQQVDGSGGQAKSTKANIKLVISHLNDWWFWHENTPTAELEQPWGALSAEQLSRLVQSIVKDYANFLLHVHKKANGEPYAQSTICNYISTAYNESWKHPSMKAIRDGPEADTPSAFMYARFPNRDGQSSQRWMLSLKAASAFERSKMGIAVGRGDGKGATPLARSKVKAIIKAFATEGSRTGASNTMAVVAGWISSGRGGESGFLSYHMMTYNEELQQASIIMSQQKRGKEKLVCAMAGHSRFICLFTATGTYFSFPPTGEVGDVPWIIPGQPSSTKLTAILKSVVAAELVEEPAASSSSASASASASASFLDGRGNKPKPKKKGRFSEFTVEGLPREISSGSLRHGTLDLLTLEVALQHVLMASGHAGSERSAMWEYVSSCISRLQAAAIVLHDFPPLPWGQNGRGSVPARFEALTEFTTKTEKFHEFISLVLHLPHRPKVLRRGGRLYKFTLACAAQLVMWYNEREKCDEFSSRLLFMAQCYVDVFAPRVTIRTSGAVVAHRALAKWSHALHADWLTRNAHMTARARAHSSGDHGAEMVALMKAHEM